jgi:hypothetical protein
MSVTVKPWRSGPTSALQSPGDASSVWSTSARARCSKISSQPGAQPAGTSASSTGLT